MQESETESEYSMAPTDTYMSPRDSLSGLSDIDLTLGSGISKFDLLKQMSKTMRNFHGGKSMYALISVQKVIKL